jgi:hypothetical protein
MKNLFTISISPLHIGYVEQRRVFRPSPVKQRVGYKYVYVWSTAWGQPHGFMSPTPECDAELERLRKEPLERCMKALAKAKARYHEKYKSFVYEDHIVEWEIPYPQIPTAKRPIMSRAWQNMTRERFILEQAEQQAKGKIHNVISAYQAREFATAKGCYHDLNQWYLSLCSVARPDHHIVKFRNHDKFIQSFRAKKNKKSFKKAS